MESWICHICGETRPDDRISVLTKPIMMDGKVVGNQNIRFCNDKRECVTKAREFGFFKKVDIARCREILIRLTELGLPLNTLQGIRQWIDQKEVEIEMGIKESPKPELPEVYKGWTIYYSGSPRPLWTASKGFEKSIHSYEGLERIKHHIDEKEV